MLILRKLAHLVCPRPGQEQALWEKSLLWLLGRLQLGGVWGSFRPNLSIAEQQRTWNPRTQEVTALTNSIDHPNLASFSMGKDDTQKKCPAQD